MRQYRFIGVFHGGDQSLHTQHGKHESLHAAFRALADSHPQFLDDLAPGGHFESLRVEVVEDDSDGLSPVSSRPAPGTILPNGGVIGDNGLMEGS